MFEYTCPKCQNTSTTTTANGAVTPCAACGQRLCVMPEEAAPAGGAPRGWGTPLLAASSGLAGLVVAAGIMLVWLFVGRGLVAGGKAVAVVPQTVAEVGGGAPEAPKEPIKDAPPKDPIKNDPPKDTGMGDIPPKDTGMGDVTPKDPIKDAPPKDPIKDAPKKPDGDKPAPSPPPPDPPARRPHLWSRPYRRRSTRRS